MKFFVAFFVLAVVAMASAKQQLIGGNPCTWGPSYWCASEEHIQKCGGDASICEKYAANAANAVNVFSTLVGGNPCTWGPSFWCSSEANMNQCGMDQTSCAKYNN